MTVLNESAHIERCLASLSWAHEIILVDTGSTDDTVAIASRFPNVFIHRRTWKGYAQTKQEALNLATHPWVLWVDGDEEISPELSQALQSTLGAYEPTFAFSMPRKNFVLGQWVRYGGWFPDRVLRLFPRDLASFGQEALHEKVILDSAVTTRHLSAPLYHYTYSSWGQYYKKMIRYAYLGALTTQKKGTLVILFKLLTYPPYLFIRSYCLKLGILDGKLGFLLALGNATGALMRYSYALLLKSHNEPPP